MPNQINWIVWDSCAWGSSGWEDDWTDTCGDVGFATLSDAWKYYRKYQGYNGLGYNGKVIHQWCTPPRSVVVHAIDTRWCIPKDD